MLQTSRLIRYLMPVRTSTECKYRRGETSEAHFLQTEHQRWRASAKLPNSGQSGAGEGKHKATTILFRHFSKLERDGCKRSKQRQ